MKSAQFNLYFQIHISNENVVRNTCFLIQSIKEKKIHIYGQHSTKELSHKTHKIKIQKFRIWQQQKKCKIRICAGRIRTLYKQKWYQSYIWKKRLNSAFKTINSVLSLSNWYFVSFVLGWWWFFCFNFKTFDWWRVDDGWCSQPKIVYVCVQEAVYLSNTMLLIFVFVLDGGNL